MLSKDMISVIVPVFNVQDYLQRCVNSLLFQTYSNLEIILVDDGSTDKSGEMCDEFAKKDRRVRAIHQKNGGASSARNTGMDWAKGDFIGFIDSDDWIDPRMYEVLYSNLCQHDADVSDINSIVTDHYCFIDNNPETIHVYTGDDILKDYFIYGKYSVCRKLYRKEIIQQTRFPEGIGMGEDIYTNFHFLRHANRQVKSSLVMYYYYNNPHSVTGAMFKEKDFELIDICNAIVSQIDNNPELLSLAENKLAISYYSLLGRYIMYPHTEMPNLEIRVSQLHTKLRKNYWRLMCSQLGFAKKSFISIVSLVSPHVLKGIINWVKRVRSIKLA